MSRESLRDVEEHGECCGKRSDSADSDERVRRQQGQRELVHLEFACKTANVCAWAVVARSFLDVFPQSNTVTWNRLSNRLTAPLHPIPYISALMDH